MTFSLKSEWPQWLVLASMWALAIATWRTSPDRIPVHWNLAGEVDRWGGKFEGLLLMPIVATVVYLLFLLLPLIDPRRRNYAEFAGTYAVLRFTILLVMAGIAGFIQLAVRDPRFDVGRAIGLLVGMLFVILGVMMNRIRPNWFVGVRTPWWLSSERSWIRTHRVARGVFTVLGVLVVITSLTRSAWAFWMVIIGLLVATFGLMIYSYLVWKNDPDKEALGGGAR